MTFSWFSEATKSALLATGIISAAPNLILFLFPSFAGAEDVDGVKSSTTKQGIAILSLGQAMAAGGLLGDVFLHTLPHVMSNSMPSSHDDNDGHSQHELIIGQCVLTGFLTFLIFDGIIRIYSSHKHSHCEEVHHNSNSHANNNINSETDKSNDDIQKQHRTTTKFTSTVILNLVVDALHNFTDGLAIGASFAVSSSTSSSSILQSQGGIVSFSVFFHEIPHELGDYSILLSYGFTKMETIMAQFFTATAAFMGTIVGLLLSSQTMTHDSHNHHDEHDHHHQHHSFNSYLLLSFTSGGFLYLACCGILPELLNHKVSDKLRILQLLAFCCGIGFMQFVAILEHEYEHGHHHHDDHHHHEL